MSLDTAIESLEPRHRTRQTVAWVGGVLIGVIVAMAGYDIVRSYRATVDDTGRDLDNQARIIAEQTARTVQAVDVALRHLADQYRKGALAMMTADDLRAYLKEQAVGLVQIEGLVLIGSDGVVYASSYIPADLESRINIADREAFTVIRDDRTVPLIVGDAQISNFDQKTMFPIVRRLETSTGEFAGVVGARGRIEYFQDVYRDLRLDTGTNITLMQTNGTLLARHPPVSAALGQRIPQFDQMMLARKSQPSPMRTVSPLDGVDRYISIALVPGYPLAIIASRDVSTALAPWRAQSIGTAARTLALAALAALLLAIVMRQITRLHKAHESLQVSQERYAIAMTGSNEAHWVWDIASDQLYASPLMREIYGIAPDAPVTSRAEFLARMPIHADDAERARQAVTDHVAGLTPRLDNEFRIVDPATGRVRWVHTRGQCFRDAQGKVVRLAGATVDVTERAEAEAALRQSEERFALAVAGSKDGVIDWDIANDRMFTSIRAMRIAGIDSNVTVRARAEWMAMLKLHPDDVARHDEDMSRHLAGETEVREGEYRVLHPNGSYHWVRVRGMSVRDAAGHPIRWAGSVSDIDAQKQAEQALRKSEERFQLAVTGSNQGLWDWDLATDTMFVSPRAQEFMGLEPSEPLRPRREWIARSTFHPDDAPRVREATSAHLHGRTKHYAAEFRLRHRSGEWHWYRQRGVALRDESGRPYRMAGSMEDITEQKNADAERQRLEGQLLQAKKLEAMGTLAGGIAHDFNNILSAILGYGEMAQKDAAEGTAMRRHIDAAMSAGMRAKSLVQRILAFSRSGMGERKPVDVHSVVGEALDLVAASAPSGVRIERRLDARDVAVMGDATQVHQVVMNLCTNAVHAMKSGGTLTVALDIVDEPRAVVATSVLSRGRYVRLAVSDTGSGIPESVRDRIFDPFFTTKDVGVGTGLGLSLVHGIVTDLGGGIDVASRDGHGTTFTVYLPCRSGAAAGVVVDDAIARGSGETVLLVDDEDTLVRLGEEMIAELGYEPIGFTSSNAALARFRATPQRFDVVLSDESMPEMTGSELAAEIRKIRPDIPIVLMSGYVSAALSARARDAGVADVLAKPLVSRDIARSLAGALRPLTGAPR